VIRIRRVRRPPETWESLWAADPRATLFLHPRWMNALLEGYPRYRPLYLLVESGGGTAGLLPLVRVSRFGLLQYLSLPFGTYGGPLLAPGSDPGVAGALIRAFRDLGRTPRCMRFELTLFDPPPDLRQAAAAGLGEAVQEFRTHLVDLSRGMPHLWERGYRRGTRKCVRAAERAGVTVSVEEGEDAVTTLYGLYAAQGRDWQGITPYPLRLVRALVRGFGTEARIYVARRAGTALAACLFLDHAGREIHPFVSGAALEGRRHRAFHLLIHTALEDACARGLRLWDFGGSGGDRRIEYFKESFGAEPRPLLRGFHMPAWARRLRKQPAWDV